MDQIKLLLTIVCCLFFIMSANGKEPKKKGDVLLPALQTQLMDRQVSELMADKVNVGTNVVMESLAEVEYLSEDDLFESEALRFPSDELYGSSWDTTWVNPFRNKEIEMPDTFNVDCRSFTIPIDGEVKVTSNYGPRRRRMHRGIDLKVQVGDTIRSAFSGKVRIKGFERRGYGYYLVIRHTNGLETIYGHLSKFLVSENDIVKTGEPIALGGNTGRSTGSHLHFETRFLGQALNPNNLIDFENGVPHEDFYAVYKNNTQQRTNVYTSTSERIVYHRVKKGETLGQIALKYKTSVNELCRLNGLSRKSTLRIGQSIRCGTTSVRATKKEEPASASIEENTSQNTALYHKVQTNETLSSIARQYGTTVDALCRLNNIQSTSPLSIGQELCYKGMPKSSVKKADGPKNEVASVSDKKTEAQPENKTSSKPSSTVYHTVSKGETLGRIASQYGTSVDELCRLNGISKTATLRLGQKLRCQADQTANKANDNIAAASSSKSSQTKSTKTVYYRVKAGDTLGAIARKHGVTVDRLCEMNSITSTTILKVGRSLRCS
ncbi:MAG: LysM peptidoglycan-binding domain-containing protein [Tannerella sp.]|jgi:murein DD-endopeptidase MepM/ murein hydrolase activator NlpD|nr:LysM peptidoglycan-binding domain-containing protein [Tannerella sp.]